MAINGSKEELSGPIKEEETLGYWYNRSILWSILLLIYQGGTVFSKFPTFTELWIMLCDKIE